VEDKTMSFKLKLMTGVAAAMLISGAASAQTYSTQTVPKAQQQTQSGADDAQQPQGQTRERRQRQQAEEVEGDTEQARGQTRERRQRQQAEEAEGDTEQAQGQTRERRQRQQAEEAEGDTEQAQGQTRERRQRQQAEEAEDDTEQAQDRRRDRRQREEARDRDDDDQEQARERRRDRQDRREARRDRDRDRVDIDATIDIDLSPRQRTVIYERFLTADIEPVSVGVDVVVGETVPTVVALHPVPTEVVEVVPEFRDHMHFVLADERVAIVDPCTMRIVAILS
jgi:cell division protein FtsN